MALPNYKDLSNLSTVDQINEEILNLQKSLFKLRAKKAINQPIKPPLFSHFKRKIAQLKFKKSSHKQEFNL